MKNLNQQQFDTALKNLQSRGLSESKKQHILYGITGGEQESLAQSRKPILAKLVSGFVGVSLLAFSGVALASDAAVPGDTLYEFEVSVVEPFVALFQFGDAARADYNLALATERITELVSVLESDQTVAILSTAGTEIESFGTTEPASFRADPVEIATTRTAPQLDFVASTFVMDANTERSIELFNEHIDSVIESGVYDPAEIDVLRQSLDEVLNIDNTPTDSQKYLTPEEIEPLL